MVYVVALQELGKLNGCEGGTIIGVDKVGWSVLGDELLRVLGQGIGGLGCDFRQEGVLAEEIADKQVLLAFMGEVIGCNLLPLAVGDVSGRH